MYFYFVFSPQKLVLAIVLLKVILILLSFTFNYFNSFVDGTRELGSSTLILLSFTNNYFNSFWDGTKELGSYTWTDTNSSLNRISPHLFMHIVDSNFSSNHPSQHWSAYMPTDDFDLDSYKARIDNWVDNPMEFTVHYVSPYMRYIKDYEKWHNWVQLEDALDKANTFEHFKGIFWTHRELVAHLTDYVDDVYGQLIMDKYSTEENFADIEENLTILVEHLKDNLQYSPNSFNEVLGQYRLVMYNVSCVDELRDIHVETLNFCNAYRSEHRDELAQGALLQTSGLDRLSRNIFRDMKVTFKENPIFYEQWDDDVLLERSGLSTMSRTVLRILRVTFEINTPEDYMEDAVDLGMFNEPTPTPEDYMQDAILSGMFDEPTSMPMSTPTPTPTPEDCTEDAVDSGMFEEAISNPEEATPTPEEATPTPEGATPTPEEPTSIPEETTPTPEDYMQDAISSGMFDEK